MDKCLHPEKSQMIVFNMDINDNIKIVQTFCGKCNKELPNQPKVTQQ